MSVASRLDVIAEAKFSKKLSQHPAGNDLYVKAFLVILKQPKTFPCRAVSNAGTGLQSHFLVEIYPRNRSNIIGFPESNKTATHIIEL